MELDKLNVAFIPWLCGEPEPVEDVVPVEGEEPIVG